MSSASRADLIAVHDKDDNETIDNDYELAVALQRQFDAELIDVSDDSFSALDSPVKYEKKPSTVSLANQQGITVST